MRVDYALRQHEQWYKGDGAYGDGPAFHWDYYNSFVIHPMLRRRARRVRRRDAGVEGARAPRSSERARRYAAVQERLIAPDGSFPADRPIARVSLRRVSSAGAVGAAARAARGRVAGAGARRADGRDQRTLDAPGTFDADGWLRIGFCGHQPGVGETYISTGSLYLCAVAIAAARAAAERRVLVGAAAAVDVGARVERAAVPDRPRAGDVIRLSAPEQEIRRSGGQELWSPQSSDLQMKQRLGIPSSAASSTSPSPGQGNSCYQVSPPC